MTGAHRFLSALAAAILSVFLSAVPAAAAGMEGEATTFDTYQFESETYWGKATVTVIFPALRYRFFSLFSEPAYALHLRYGIARVVLKNREGQKVTIDVDNTSLPFLGADYTTFVRRNRDDHLTVGAEVIKSLRMIDVDIAAPLNGAPAMLYRRMPGVLGAPGSWSMDVPGSPAWNRLFVRFLANLLTDVADLGESDYLDAEAAKTAWRQLVERSKTQAIIQTFSIGNAVFDIQPFIARINEINPEALDGFFDRPAPQRQADALVGAYVGAVEALRDEDGFPPDDEAIRRRRNVTVRALNALKSAGLVEDETHAAMSRAFWEQATSGIERELVELGDEATAALSESSDPTTAAAPFRDRLAGLRARAEERGGAPKGLAGRFDRLEALLAVDCSRFVTAACEPLIELSPDDGTTVSSPVASISGRFKADYVAALQNRLVLMVGEQDQRVDLRSDGSFSTKAVLASGENDLALMLVDQDVGDGGTVLARRVITYTGRPTRLRVTLTWDTSGSDIDLHITRPGGSTVYYGNTSSGDLRLDVDNTEGYGPENISTEEIEQGSYAISVVNYRGGVGTTATLHIYRDERLDRRETHLFSETRERWEAGSVVFE